jgi:prevent-host-death family protein
MFVDSTNHKGAVAEAAITAEAVKLGIGVLRPLADERYDLIFDMRPGLLRVQCKCARRNRDVLQIHTAGSWYSPGRGYVRSTYGHDEIDAVAAYCAELERCYLLPVSVVAGHGQIHLRLERPRNGQRAAINWAAEYQLPGAIAQLGERLTGSQEAVGSSPTSSIPVHAFASAPPAALAAPNRLGGEPLKDTVGMDEFDARIAHYIRHAEAGNVVLVTRWGKPVARLGPPNPVIPVSRVSRGPGR